MLRTTGDLFRTVTGAMGECAVPKVKGGMGALKAGPNWTVYRALSPNWRKDFEVVKTGLTYEQANKILQAQSKTN